jgi:hypothetical protein
MLIDVGDVARGDITPALTGLSMRVKSPESCNGLTGRQLRPTVAVLVSLGCVSFFSFVVGIGIQSLRR